MAHETHKHRYARLQIEARVAHGAVMLDDRVGLSTWVTTMLRYLPVFDIADASICVIGSLLRGSVINGVAASLGIEDIATATEFDVSRAFNEWLRKEGYDDGREHGFNTPLFPYGVELGDGQAWTLLTEAWMREIYYRTTPYLLDQALYAAEDDLQRAKDRYGLLDSRTVEAIRVADVDRAENKRLTAQYEEQVASRNALRAELDAMEEKHAQQQQALRDRLSESARAIEDTLAQSTETTNNGYASQKAVENHQASQRGVKEAIYRFEQQITALKRAQEQQAALENAHAMMIPLPDLMEALRADLGSSERYELRPGAFMGPEDDRVQATDADDEDPEDSDDEPCDCGDCNPDDEDEE